MFYNIQHLIYPAYKEVKLRWTPVWPVSISKEEKYEACLYAFSGIRRYSYNDQIPGSKPDLDAANAYIEKMLTLSKEDNILTLTLRLPQEDSYFVDLYQNGTKLERYEIYALGIDLFERTPMKGDNHMHSIGSDGQNAPAYMAAISAKRGCDYSALTDHWFYEPSLQSQAQIKKATNAFFVVPGEEVHAPRNHVHILNIGGSASANAWTRDHLDEYNAAVEKELSDIPDSISERDRVAIASSQVIFDKIAEYDGVSGLAHPHWIVENGFQESDDITAYLFDHKRFQVLELIAGGAFEDGTQLQISYYQERDKMSIVGDSDAHQAGLGFLSPINYTILFAKTRDVGGVKEAIRNGYSIGGYEKRLFGDFRLLKYAYFLQRNLMDAHDNAAREIGECLVRYVSAGCPDEFDGTDYLRHVAPASDIFTNAKYNA